MQIPESEWEWFGLSGHLIVSMDCRFHMCTLIGDVLVSTVGMYLPDSQVREGLARSRGIELEGRGDARRYDWLRKNNGYEEIGVDRKFETMAFMAGPRCEVPGCNCGQPSIAIATELFAEGYNDPRAAREGHMRACRLAAEGKISDAAAEA